MIMVCIEKKIFLKSVYIMLYSSLTGICAALGSAISLFACCFSDKEIYHQWALGIIFFLQFWA